MDNNAFNAMLEYERNAMTYDTPDNKPTYIPPNQRMDVYARMFGTTIDEMRKYRNDVERFLNTEQ